MKLAQSAPCVALLLLAGAKADFMIYQAQGAAFTEPSLPYDGWTIFNGEPDCNDAGNVVALPPSEDVSGTKYGVRCKGPNGGCSQGRESEIEEFEVNDDVLGHFTLYSRDGYQMVPADGGDILGQCVLDFGDDYVCACGPGSCNGLRFFICTSSLTAP